MSALQCPSIVKKINYLVDSSFMSFNKEHSASLHGVILTVTCLLLKSWSLTYPVQHIPWTDHDWCTAGAWGNSQHRRQNSNKFTFCRWYRWPSWKRGRAEKPSRANWQNLERLRHGDQCPEDQADDQRQRHQCRNQDRRSEARNSAELQIPGVHCYRPGFKAWSDCQDRTDNSCSDEAEDHLEWQEYHSKIQNQIDALLGPLYIPVRLRVMDPNKRSWKEDTGNRDEMLSQTPWHLLQRPHHQWRGDQPHPWNNRAVWRPPGNSEEKKTEILRSHHKIIRTLQNYTARHCTREKSKRKTKEKMGGQHTWMDGYGAGKDKAEDREGWRKMTAKSSVAPQRSPRLRDT